MFIIICDIFTSIFTRQNLALTTNWREKKQKDPSGRLSDIFQKLKTDGKVKERTVVQAIKYISNRKDGTKRNPKKPSCRW